jgi:hypothetical protein
MGKKEGKMRKKKEKHDRKRKESMKIEVIE